MANVGLQIAPIEDTLSLKARAYRALKTAIMDTNIYADDVDLRLDERSLSEKLGISRTPIREALAQLDQEGFVKIVPRKGVFIIRKTKSEILDMITVWAALESMAARLVTKQASDAGIAELRMLVDKYSQSDAAQFTDEYSDANILFHQAIIKLSGCELISEITDGLFFHVKSIRHRTIFEMDRAKRSIVDHKEIVAAIELRDTERAERLVREHTMKLRDHVEQHVQLSNVDG